MHQKSILLIGNYLSVHKWNKNIWHYLAEKLADSGWQVITTSSKENQLLRLIDMLKTVWQQRKNFSLAQIDVFSGKAFLYAEACTMLLTRLHKPIALTLHGGKLPEFSRRNPKRVQRLLSSVEVVVTPSPFIKSALSAFRPDIRLIPNPINLPDAIFRLRDKPAPNLIWVRAFHKVYNPNLAPRVIKVLLSEFPDIHLLMIGPDKGDGSLGHMLNDARNLGVEDKIDVVGKVPHQEIPKWLDKADIFINTTNYDNAPSSLLEAMAGGLCVVSTDVGGIPFMIENGQSGLLVPPNDAQMMANAIRSILNNVNLAKSLSQQARFRAEKNSWSVILPQWEQLLGNILHSKNQTHQ